ncbi:MAG: SurA N-terminal domain-containing protein [Oligoflexia bacterium]|nr:SurA N-terminal domain-containing protein [Oligoflexia bacterium]
MLKFWRRRQGLMVPIIFIPIIIVFIAWGMERFDNPTGGSAAVVNGTAITVQEYQNALRQLINFYSQIMQGNLDEKALTQYRIREAALQQLVSRELMAQEAKAVGIMVPDSEIQEIITSVPGLQKDGRFSKQTYMEFLKQSQISAGQFEGDLKKSSLVDKVRRLVENSGQPSRSELERESQLRSEKTEVEFLRFNREVVAKSMTASNAEVVAFASDPSNDPKIKEYYELHKFNYEKAESVKARHILIKAAKGSPEEAAAREKAQNIAKSLSPANFASTASKMSDDPGSKAKGGDLGYFERGRMVPEFEKAAFETPVGKISSVVQSDFGFHIIYVEDKKQPSKVTLDQAKNEISKNLVLKAKADRFLSELSQKMAQDPAKVATEVMALDKTLKWQSTGKFSISEEQVPGLGASPEVIEAVMGLSQEKPYAPRLLTLAEDQLILRFKNKTTESPLEPAKLAAELTQERSRLIGQLWSTALSERAKIKTNPRIAGN